MQFIDETKVHLKAGKGADGCVSFRREKFIPNGGPDGGNGGNGASIAVRAVSNLNTLIDYRYRQHFKGDNGEPGRGKNCHGASKKTLFLNVPVGTQIFTENGEVLIADLSEEGQTIIIAQGGYGGKGNANFKSSTNQAPRIRTKGTEGEELSVWLKLKLFSDIGIIGLPNAGKSTFISTVSAARPKIADYPFTTLKPKLGMVIHNFREIVFADIPGLIEGASQGHGLGHRFLKHVERCKILLHLIDISSEDPVKDYTTIRNELALYNPALAEKEEIVAFTKIDICPEEKQQEYIAEFENKIGRKAYLISTVTNQNISSILEHAYQIIHGKIEE